MFLLLFFRYCTKSLSEEVVKIGFGGSPPKRLVHSRVFL
jgi:hypothetical protein